MNAGKAYAELQMLMQQVPYHIHADADEQSGREMMLCCACASPQKPEAKGQGLKAVHSIQINSNSWMSG